jgi:hypothetical protein
MSVVAHEGASFIRCPNITEEITVVLRSRWLYNVEVCELVLAQLLNHVGELGLWIRHAHTCAEKQLNQISGKNH